MSADHEAEIIDLDNVRMRTVELVDSPEAQRPPRLPRSSQRRPIVPPWLRSRGELRDAAAWLAAHAAHVSAYHATRTPKYAARLVGRSPRGAARLVAGTVRWVLDAEGRPVRQAAVRREDAGEYLKLLEARDARVRNRGAVAATAALLASAGLVAVALYGAAWARWALLGGLVAVLGVLGAPAGPAAAGRGRGGSQGGQAHQRPGGPRARRALPRRDQPGAGPQPQGDRLPRADHPRWARVARRRGPAAGGDRRGGD